MPRVYHARELRAFPGVRGAQCHHSPLGFRVFQRATTAAAEIAPRCMAGPAPVPTWRRDACRLAEAAVFDLRILQIPPKVRMERDRGFLHDLALRRRRKWNPQAIFQIFQTMPGKFARVAIMLAADSSYFFSPASGGRVHCSRTDCSAVFQLIDGGRPGAPAL